MKLALVGSTGLVGKVMVKVLEEQKLPVSVFYPVASNKSIGKMVTFQGEEYPVINIQQAVDARPDVAIFSAGGNVSKEWAPRFAENGCIVIDNSSAWRMDPTKKLIVPEINADQLSSEDKIIANPNCSTIQMVMALAPLERKYGLKRLVVSTYQSITGTGKEAIDQYNRETLGEDRHAKDPYPHKIFENCLPHCDIFLDNDYTKEEMKLVNETRKILGREDIGITATAVRVPVMGGHSESINVELIKDFEIEDIKEILNNTPGVVVLDDPDHNEYPMPLNAQGRDEVFVGRIREDESQPRTLNMWVVADNLRKGAATNAVQIADYLVKEGILKAQVTV